MASRIDFLNDKRKKLRESIEEFTQSDAYKKITGRVSQEDKSVAHLQFDESAQKFANFFKQPLEKLEKSKENTNSFIKKKLYKAAVGFVIKTDKLEKPEDERTLRGELNKINDNQSLSSMNKAGRKTL